MRNLLLGSVIVSCMAAAGWAALTAVEAQHQLSLVSPGAAPIDGTDPIGQILSGIAPSGANAGGNSGIGIIHCNPCDNSTVN